MWLLSNIDFPGLEKHIHIWSVHSLNTPNFFFSFGDRAGENRALPFLAWDHESAKKADQMIGWLFPIHIN